MKHINIKINMVKIFVQQYNVPNFKKKLIQLQQIILFYLVLLKMNVQLIMFNIKIHVLIIQLAMPMLPKILKYLKH